MPRQSNFASDTEEAEMSHERRAEIEAWTCRCGHITTAERCEDCGRLRDARGDETQPLSPFMLRAADRLYSECERAVREHRIDARSPIGDATLDYREIREEGGPPVRDARGDDEPARLCDDEALVQRAARALARCSPPELDLPWDDLPAADRAPYEDAGIAVLMELGDTLAARSPQGEDQEEAKVEAQLAKHRPVPLRQSEGPCPQCADTAGGFRCADCDWQGEDHEAGIEAFREVLFKWQPPLRDILDDTALDEAIAAYLSVSAPKADEN